MKLSLHNGTRRVLILYLTIRVRVFLRDFAYHFSYTVTVVDIVRNITIIIGCSGFSTFQVRVSCTLSCEYRGRFSRAEKGKYRDRVNRKYAIFFFFFISFTAALTFEHIAEKPDDGNRAAHTRVLVELLQVHIIIVIFTAVLSLLFTAVSTTACCTPKPFLLSPVA